MICYKDRTYCPFFTVCKKGYKCDRALTQVVKMNARRWWGLDNGEPPIMMYTDYPDCYEEII